MATDDFPSQFLIAKIFQNCLVSGDPATAARDGEPGPAARERPLAKTMLTFPPHRITHLFFPVNPLPRGKNET